MQRFYLRNYRVTFMAQATPSGNSEKHGGYCLNEYGASLPDFGTHTCFSLVEAHYDHAGPLLIGRLPQYDPLARKLLSEGVGAEVLTYSKINARRRSSMRLCRVFHRNITNPVTWSQHNDNFIPDHHCMIVSGPHIYIQFCCCNTNLFDCSMRRGISQGHDEESAEEIICAIGKQPNCYTESVYRSIFMWSIRSSLDENYQVFCNVHYDYAKKKIVSLLPHNNILLTTAASPRLELIGQNNQWQVRRVRISLVGEDLIAGRRCWIRIPPEDIVSTDQQT
ncbi:hypothetical protein Tcan_09104 [Toxocara canis]|uniref:Uncharacterized protein n=1 Tax=Toxocara canis TaxID=6265 RepID=A0A0B2VRK9_TOXCA|nr:hypothetical protein Tcan_09104 [Toxocara canis]